MSECFVNVVPVSDPLALCRGVAAGNGSAQAVADGARVEWAAALEVEVEPRSRLVRLDPIHCFRHSFIRVLSLRVTEASEACVYLRTAFRGLGDGALSLFAPRVRGTKADDWPRFRVLRVAWVPCWADVSVTPAWGSSPVDAEALPGLPCDVREFRLSGAPATWAETDAVATAGLPAFDVTGYPVFAVEGRVSGQAVPDGARADGIVETLRDLPVTGSSRGGLVEADIVVAPCDWTGLPVAGATRGDALAGVSARVRETIYADADVVVEVTADA